MDATERPHPQSEVETHSHSLAALVDLHIFLKVIKLSTIN
jgi:hypothetical protein